MKRQLRWTGLAAFVLLLSMLAVAGAYKVGEPQPGDFFREHVCMDTTGVEPNNWIRVQIRKGNPQGSTVRRFRGEVDLEGATRAVVRVQKLLCHDDTKGLAIHINYKPAISVPESDSIPAPQEAYQHMTYPVFEVPLSYLKPGANTFTMTVLPQHAWSYPQNIIYGVTLMVFYGPGKPHPTGAVTAPTKGAGLGTVVRLEASATPAPGGPAIARVDYIGHYEDFNYEGDGVYRQWHYHYLRDKMSNHLGSGTRGPSYMAAWNTYDKPDQKHPIKIAARIVDESGMVYITPPVDGLTFNRPGTSIRMYKPYDIPKTWVTRKAVYTTHFDIPQSTDLSKVHSAKLVWASWSASYSAGILVNGTKVIPKPGPAPHYDLAFHKISIDKTVLKTGKNSITTEMRKYGEDGTTKLHGMEVLWPGIVPFVRFKNAPSVGAQASQESQTFHFRRETQGLYVTAPGKGMVTAGIYGINGQCLISVRGKSSSAIRIPSAQLKSGVYLMRINAGGKAFSKRFCHMR